MKRAHCDQNRVKGLCAGLLNGDALGAPFEFGMPKEGAYNGQLDKMTRMQTRWQGVKTLEPAQVTDDSEMTLALLGALVRHNGVFDETTVVQSYCDWAHSTWTLGKNTRRLFKRFKSATKCMVEIANDQLQPVEKMSQSNGCLMRCSPFAFYLETPLEKLDALVRQDCRLSNPHPLCQEACSLYVQALQKALRGESRDSIWQHLVARADSTELKALIKSVETQEARNVKQQKGWVLHAFWFALQMLRREFTNFADAMHWIIAEHPGSDTDTNASIAGALLGALTGYQAMDRQSQENYEKINSLTLRPVTYRPARMLEWALQLVRQVSPEIVLSQ